MSWGPDEAKINQKHNLSYIYKFLGYFYIVVLKDKIHSFIGDFLL